MFQTKKNLMFVTTCFQECWGLAWHLHVYAVCWGKLGRSDTLCVSWHLSEGSVGEKREVGWECRATVTVVQSSRGTVVPRNQAWRSVCGPCCIGKCQRPAVLSYVSLLVCMCVEAWMHKLQFGWEVLGWHCAGAQTSTAAPFCEPATEAKASAYSDWLF